MPTCQKAVFSPAVHNQAESSATEINGMASCLARRESKQADHLPTDSHYSEFLLATPSISSAAL